MRSHRTVESLQKKHDALYTALCDPDLRRVEDYRRRRVRIQTVLSDQQARMSKDQPTYGPGSAKDARFAYYPPSGEASGSGVPIGSHGQGFTFPMGSRKWNCEDVLFRTSSQWASQSRTRGENQDIRTPCLRGHEEDYENFEEFGDVSRHPDGLVVVKRPELQLQRGYKTSWENAKPDRRLPFSYARGLGDLNPGILADAAPARYTGSRPTPRVSGGMLGTDQLHAVMEWKCH